MPIPNRHLHHPQSPLCRPHLHLDRPAIIPVLHSQIPQHSCPHSPKRPQIRSTLPPKQIQQRRGQPIPKPLMSPQRPLRRLPQHPRPNHQIRLTTQDRRHQKFCLSRILTPVGLQVHQDHVIRHNFKHGQTSRSVAFFCGRHHSRPSFFSLQRSFIARTIVRNHHLRENAFG